MDWQNEQPAVSAPINGDQTDSAFYKIKDPVGYALLLGCSSQSSSHQGLGSPPSVREDLTLVENTLKKMGWCVYSPCLDNKMGAAKLTGDSCEQIVNNLERNELALQLSNLLREFYDVIYMYSKFSIFSVQHK